MIACTRPSVEDAGLAFRVHDLTACRARALAENGFQALAGGSMFAQFLSGVMIIAVALIGYRLMLGDRPSTRNGVLWLTRIGVVLALTSSWSAFDTVFARVVLDGPGDIAAVVLPAAGSNDPDTLVGRVQAGYDGIVAAGLRSSARDPAARTSAVPIPDVAAEAQAAGPVEGGERSIRPLALRAAAIVFVAAGLGAPLAAEVAAGLLLALGPLFVASLLLDASRGMFEGWVRALALTCLGSMVSMAVLSIELDVLATELARAPSSAVDPGALLVIVTLFAIVTAASWWACAMAAGRIHLPTTSFIGWTIGAMGDRPAPGIREVDQALARTPAGESSRVAAINEAILRRDRDAATRVVSSYDVAASGGRPGGRSTRETVGSPVPAGSGSSPRRTGWQSSATAKRRDGET